MHLNDYGVRAEYGFWNGRWAKDLISDLSKPAISYCGERYDLSEFDVKYHGTEIISVSFHIKDNKTMYRQWNNVKGCFLSAKQLTQSTTFVDILVDCEPMIDSELHTKELGPDFGTKNIHSLIAIKKFIASKKAER